MIRKFKIVLVLAMAFSMMACSSPSGKITQDSKTEACEQELLNALRTFSSDLGLSFDVNPEDAKTIFNKGEVVKEYGLAGYHYTAYFGLEAGAEGCSLTYYKQKKKGPGETSTTWGDYGYVDLSECKCEE